MTELNVKRRMTDAKKSAKIKFENMGYAIINSDNCVFCFVASRAGIYERKIRVVVDKIKDSDINIVKSAKILPNQTKEIWCRPFGSREWETLEFDHLNNPVNS
jgi:hypothetical protein